MNRSIYLAIFLFFALHDVHAQAKKWYNNFSIEAGAGYNTAQWKYTDDPLSHDTIFRRTVFGIQPSVRLSYNISVSKKDSLKLLLTPFVGYYIFGGKSRTEPNGYKDRFLFNSIEIGIIPSMRICKNFYVGVGIKGQYILSAKAKYYGSLGQPDSVPRQWQTNDYSNVFNSYAMSAGVQIKYRIKKFTVGAEGWYGLTNLNSLESPFFTLRVTENNYRVMIGYDF